MTRYKVGLWVPTRSRLTPISIENPGMWLEGVKEELVTALRHRDDLDIVDGLDFRRAHVRSGEVILGDFAFSSLDVFFWFGEIDRRHTSFHLDVLDAIGERTAVVNGAAATRIALDKLLTQRILLRSGIPVPEFLFVSRHNVDAVRDLFGEKSFLMKPRLGSFGVGITRVASHDHLVDIVDYSEQEAHFLEEYIDYDPEGFIGVNVVGGRVVSAYGKELSKFRGWKVLDRGRQGGGMVSRAPTAEQARIAVEVAQVTGLDLLGVDILRSRAGRDYVVDVNSFPGLYPDLSGQGGVDAVEAMVDMLCRKLEERRAAPKRAPTSTVRGDQDAVCSDGSTGRLR